MVRVLTIAMLSPEIAQLVRKFSASELLQALADAYEEDLLQNPPGTTYRLKREVTIEGLRELSKHERFWS